MAVIKKLFPVIAAALFAFSGCREAPKGSLVVHKDLDNLIFEALDTENEEKVGMDSLAGKYETYKTEINSDTFGLTVNVDAEVFIPDVEKMSVYRVRQKKITDDFIDNARRLIIGESPLYDAEAVNDSPDPANDDTLNEHKSDGHLRKVTELLDASPESKYYKWQYELNASGEVVYAATDGSDGVYATLYAQNNEEKGNKLSIRKSSSKYDYGTPYGVMVWPQSLDTVSDPGGALPPNTLTNGIIFSSSPTQLPGDTADLSRDAAESEAYGFLSSLGLNEFRIFDGGLFNDIHDIEAGVYYRTYYIFICCRYIDGVPFDQASGTKKYFGDGSDGDYRKLEWPGEYAVVYVNDAGVVGFDYLAPIEVTEKVVDGAALQPFEAVCEVFERMMPVKYVSESVERTVSVARVRLTYSRISEQDSFDTGLIVPVWNFSGYNEAYFSGIKISGDARESVLCINAIDKTVIDPDLGY